MAAALLLSFEATAVNGSGWIFSYSSSKTRNLRNLAVTTESGSTSTATSSLPFPSSTTSSSPVSHTHKGSKHAKNATHEYFPQAWNTTGEENTTSDMTAFADDDGIQGFADKVTYFDPIKTLNGEPLINNNTSDATLVPREMDQPSAWPLVVLVIFLLAAVGLCVSTAYKNRKRSGYQAVPATTSLVV